MQKNNHFRHTVIFLYHYTNLQISCTIKILKLYFISNQEKESKSITFCSICLLNTYLEIMFIKKL